MSILCALLGIGLLVASLACAPGRTQGQPQPTATRSAGGPPPPPPAPSPTTSTAGAGISSQSGMITVVRPTSGEEVRSPIRVQGSASVFEGNVQVIVRNARGEAAGQGFTTASAGAPGRGEYNAAIPFTAAGRQTGVVEVFSPSAQDGRPQHLVSIPVILVPN